MKAKIFCQTPGITLYLKTEAFVTKFMPISRTACNIIKVWMVDFSWSHLPLPFKQNFMCLRALSAIGRRVLSVIERRALSVIGRRALSVIERRALSVIGRRALSVIELAGLKTRLRKVLSEGQGEFSRRVYESIS